MKWVNAHFIATGTKYVLVYSQLILVITITLATGDLLNEAFFQQMLHSKPRSASK